MLTFVTPKDLLEVITTVYTSIKTRFNAITKSLDDKIGDAPKNGKPHVRKDNAWVELPEQQQQEEVKPCDSNDLINEVKKILEE
jgi:hypothetical protein